MNVGQVFVDLQERRRAKAKVKSLLEESAAIVETEKKKGFLPRVYLIGEAHTEHTHIAFANQVIERVKPSILLWELIDEPFELGDNPLTKTLNMLLEDRGMTEYSEAMTEYVMNSRSNLDDWKLTRMNKTERERMKKIKEKREEKFATQLASYQREKLMDTSFYTLPETGLSLLLYAVERVLADESVPIIKELENRILDLENKGDRTKLLKLKDYFYDPLHSEEDVHELLQEGIVDYSSVTRLINFNVTLSKIYDYWHVNKIIDMDEVDKIDRRRARITLSESTSRLGIPLYPFDDVAARADYLKDPEGTNKRREAKMQQILFDEVTNRGGVIVTYGGANHIRDKSPVLGRLEKEGIPYHAIRLRMEGNMMERFIKSTQYSASIRASYTSSASPSR